MLSTVFFLWLKGVKVENCDFLFLFLKGQIREFELFFLFHKIRTTFNQISLLTEKKNYFSLSICAQKVLMMEEYKSGWAARAANEPDDEIIRSGNPVNRHSSGYRSGQLRFIRFIVVDRFLM